MKAAGRFQGSSYLGQQHWQSHDEVLCQFVLIVYLGLPLFRCQHLDKKVDFILNFRGGTRWKNDVFSFMTKIVIHAALLPPSHKSVKDLRAC